MTAISHAISGLARDAATARTTIKGYLAVLEDTLLAVRLSAFEARLRARERKHPKLYWVDSGVMRAAKQQLGLALEERGALLEGWVFTLLRAHNANGAVFDEAAYSTTASTCGPWSGWQKRSRGAHCGRDRVSSWPQEVG